MPFYIHMDLSKSEMQRELDGIDEWMRKKKSKSSRYANIAKFIISPLPKLRIM